jgi:hypothetical protein
LYDATSVVIETCSVYSIEVLHMGGCLVACNNSLGKEGSSHVWVFGVPVHI